MTAIQALRAVEEEAVTQKEESQQQGCLRLGRRSLPLLLADSRESPRQSRLPTPCCERRLHLLMMMMVLLLSKTMAQKAPAVLVLMMLAVLLAVEDCCAAEKRPSSRPLLRLPRSLASASQEPETRVTAETAARDTPQTLG